MQQRAATGTNGQSTFTVRYFAADWQVVLFQPAAYIEAAGLRRDVQVAYDYMP
jgi:hypothetical protein